MLHSAGVGGFVNKQGKLILDSHFVSPLNLLTEIKEACGITLDMRVGIVFNVIEDKFFFLIYCWMQFTVYRMTFGKIESRWLVLGLTTFCSAYFFR